MKQIIFTFLFLSLGLTNAQNIQETFAEANQLYQQENYKQAIEKYHAILNDDQVSSTLYYNLANSYYQTHQIAESIYFYEKALKLDPKNEDAQQNLTIVQKSIIDQIDEVPKTSFERFRIAYLSKLHYNTWAYLSTIFVLLATLLWVVFFFVFQSNRKKVLFSLSLLLSMLALGVLGVTYQQYSFEKNNHFAIVFSERVEVKSAPRNSASEVFTLHLGTKVQLIDQAGEWNKIKIADGQIGWAKVAAVKEI